MADRRSKLPHPFGGLAVAVRSTLSRWAPGLGASALSWSLVVSVTAQIATFSMSVVLARVIGRVAFGEWAALQNTVGTISVIAQLSMGVTATKFVAGLSRIDAGRVGNILGVCSAITLVTGILAAGSVAISAPWLSSVVLRAPHLEEGVRISAVSMLLLTINGYQVGALAGLERFRALAFLGALGGAVTAVCVVGFAVAWGLRGALFGYAIAAAMTWAGFHFALRGECRRVGISTSYSGLMAEIPAVAQFAFPATLAGIVGTLSLWFSMLIVVRQVEGYSEMAALSAASTLRGAVLFAPTVITRVSMPVLASMVGAGALERHKHTLRGSAALAGLSATAVALPVGIAAPWLLGLFGRSFRGSAAVLIVMVGAGIFEAVSQALNQQFLSQAKMWSNLVMATIRGLVLVTATFLLVPAGGAVGAAFAILLSQGAAVAFVVAFMARAEAAVTIGAR